jgi:hypothetical protein
MMLLLLFPIAAAITFGALSWADLRRYAPFWGPAVVLWALAIGREPSVIFLVLFLIPTIVMGVAAARHRLAATPFLLMALSDIALAIAFSIFQSKTALWTLPEIGGWGSGAGLAAAAAILRLGAAADVDDPKEGGLVSIPWWQGAMLAYWVGGPGAAVLVVGGILLWGAAAYSSHSNLAALSLAGGMLAVAAGLGADLAGVIVLGLAGTALVMGERVAATWMVAVLPLSLMTLLTLPSGPLMALAALIFPGAWAAMSTRLNLIRPTAEGLPYLSLGATLVGAGYVAANASSFFTGVGELGEGGIPVEAINAAWLVYGAGLAAMVTLSFVAGPMGMRLDPPGEAPYSKSELILPRLLPPVAWFSFFVAAVVTVRLLLAGFRTAFL